MENHQSPTLTIDSVIFQLIENKLSVLLIKRTNDPFLGHIALPGGYNFIGETTAEAMNRILYQKTGLDSKSLKYIEQLYTFDTIAKDPRGHAVSVTYMGLGTNIKLKKLPSAQSPQFCEVSKMPNLAFDHNNIVSYAIDRLRSKITYTNAIYALLPKLFTLTQLQQAYESVLGREIDKRNFRKKSLALNLIKPTEKYYQEGAHRPALMYQFQQHDLQILARSFD